MVEQIWTLYCFHFPSDPLLIRTACAVTMRSFHAGHPNIIQLVLCRYESVPAILASFDLDAACLAFAGNRIVVNPRGQRFMQTNCNILDTARQSTTYVRRIRKYYAQKKVDAAMPGYDPSRISLDKLTGPPFEYKNDLLDLVRLTGNKDARRSSAGYVGSAWTTAQLTRRALYQRVAAMYRKQTRVFFSLRTAQQPVFTMSPIELVRCAPEILSPPLLLSDRKSFFPHNENFYRRAYMGLRDVAREKKSIDDDTTKRVPPSPSPPCPIPTAHPDGTVLVPTGRSTLVIIQRNRMFDILSVETLPALYPGYAGLLGV
jgi:hypothetical protein